MSEYGKESAYKIAYEMAAANVVVVSGMALGIDSVAACGALAASGSTVAVLGCGVDVVYPKQHAALYERIAKHGAVISEFMPSTLPDKYNFPIRNRIISGLCQGTLVVEGDRHSGALITARSALMQGRDVFALPGKINESNSDGPNELIRDGANVALGAEDILSSYDFLYGDVINYKGLRKAQRKSALDESIIDELGVCARSYKVSPVNEEAHIEYGEKEKDDTTSRRAESERTEKIRQTASEEIKSEAAPRDDSALDGLDAGVRKIFEEMPIDTAVSPDQLVGEGADVSDVITALTFLELCGLVSSLPGGLYIRK
jgi:DNA processing protein